MSDVSVSSSDNQRTLDELRYDHERKLQGVRDDYARSESQEEALGAAAVSHIKRANEAKIEQMQGEGDRQIRDETERTGRNYNDLKRRATEQSEILHQQNIEAQKSAEKTGEKIHRNETEAFKQSQEQIKSFIDQQKQRQQAAQADADDRLADSVKRGDDTINKTRAAELQREKAFSSEHEKRFAALKEENDRGFELEKNEGDSRLAHQRDVGAKNIKTDREEKTKALGDVNAKYRDALGKEQQSTTAQLTKQQKDDQQKLKSDHERASMTNAEVNVRYSAESQRVQHEGEADVRERQAKFATLKKDQELGNKKKLEQLAVQLNTDEAAAQKQALLKENQDAKLREQAMQQKRSEFTQRYQVADETQKDSLHSQKEKYLQEAYKQKVKYETQMSNDADRADDPFYQIKTFQPMFTEQRDSYVLKAKVPAHEKDSVEVIVKDDKITLSAKRMFEDAFHDEAGNRTSTNSYQTYRQEFKLGVPIASEKAFKKVEDDGSITVIAPKKGFVASGRNS